LGGGGRYRGTSAGPLAEIGAPPLPAAAASIPPRLSFQREGPGAAAGCSGGLAEERGALRGRESGTERSERTEGTGGTAAGRRGHGEGPGAAPGREDRGLADSSAASTETSARESQSVYPSILLSSSSRTHTRAHTHTHTHTSLRGQDSAG